jgi:RNA polymerase primary sigma factor
MSCPTTTVTRTTTATRPATARHAGAPGLLTAEQEHRLAAAVAAGDLAARDELVRRNLGLVRVIARSYAGRGLEPDDLVGEGTLGLIRAAVGFDPAFGTRFSTYAAHWIRQAIRAALTDTAAAIRLPAHMVNLMRRWHRAEAELGPGAGFDEVADGLGLTAAQRAMVADALRSRRLGGEAGGEVAGGERPCGPAERADEAAGLRERMPERLDDRERAILSLRFGLGGGEPLTLKQVGERLGYSREYVRKLEVRAVAKLR